MFPLCDKPLKCLNKNYLNFDLSIIIVCDGRTDSPFLGTSINEVNIFVIIIIKTLLFVLRYVVGTLKLLLDPCYKLFCVSPLNLGLPDQKKTYGKPN